MYNKALLLDQRRTLLQDWADYLSAAEGSGTAWDDLAGCCRTMEKGRLFPFLNRVVVP
ncbi:hypothetical protein ECAE60S_00070 [Eoetvoesiella caeni]